MNWIQKLYETGEAIERELAAGASGPMPPGHTTAKTHIEVVLDEKGAFQSAALVHPDEASIRIPCTEESGGRSGKKPKPHPLCDSLQYVAADFREHGGQVTSGFEKDENEPHASYMAQLRAWAEGTDNQSVKAIHAYLKGGTLLADLETHGVLPFDEDGRFAKAKPGRGEEGHRIWGLLSGEQTPENAVVRWRVEYTGKASPGCWEDKGLVKSWSDYCGQGISLKGLCMVSGEEKPLARLHPAKLRHTADKAKIISSNDSSGFTFRGRFTDKEGLQACTVSDEVTQKAHSALRWLIERQGYRNGTQVFVSWASSGKDIPQPLVDDFDWDEGETEPVQTAPLHDNTRNFGQAYALKLKNYMAGYQANLADNDDIVIMGLDSATPGRMSIIYYRVLQKSEFLARLESWHQDMAWPQFRYKKAGSENKGKGKDKGNWVWSPSAPAPASVAETAYGTTASKDKDKKLHRATVERLLPCIVDGRQPPEDLMRSCVRQAINRLGFEYNWQWEKALGVACSMFKGYYARHPNPDQRRSYEMALDTNRTTRDYLYGRLLAIAEHMESTALRVGGEDRPTNATRLMQRFADHPCSTWRTIELALQPYVQRLQARRGGYLYNMKTLLDEVLALFQAEDFTNDRRLSGEFLLGYHCQRQALKTVKDQESNDLPEGEAQ